MKRFFGHLRYPRLASLAVSVAFAYLIFTARDFPAVHNLFVSLGYFGSFLAGLFYSYGETAPPATAVLLVLAKQQNIILAGIIASLGALVSDIVIFMFIRKFFSGELKKLSRAPVFRLIGRGEDRVFGRFKEYFLLLVAALFIASPLPTEVGVSIMTSLRKVRAPLAATIMFLLHTAGIFAILIIGNSI